MGWLPGTPPNGACACFQRPALLTTRSGTPVWSITKANILASLAAMDDGAVKRVATLPSDAPDTKKRRSTLVDPALARREILDVYTAYDALIAGSGAPEVHLEALIRAGKGVLLWPP